MIVFILIAASAVLWSEDFKTDTGRWLSDPRNPVLITYFAKSAKDTSGYVYIQGNLKDVGRFSAWLYAQKTPDLSTDSYVSLRLKGNGSLIRFRSPFKNHGKTPYYLECLISERK